MDVKQLPVAIEPPRALLQRPPATVRNSTDTSDSPDTRKTQAEDAEKSVRVEPAQKPPADPLERANEILNQTLGAEEPANSRLRVELDENSGRFIYKSVNAETGEVIRQYPPEQVLQRLALYRQLQGLTVNQKA